MFQNMIQKYIIKRQGNGKYKREVKRQEGQNEKV